MDTTGWTAIDWFNYALLLCIAADTVLLPIAWIVRFLRKTVFRLP